MNVTLLTQVHVGISLIGIAAGLVVLYGLLTSRRLEFWTALFLAATVATSVTGFFFPSPHFMPSHGVGIVSLVALAVAIYARYGRGLAGALRKTYVLSAVAALYLNVFVLVVQLFLKVPAIRAFAPTQSEPPYVIAHGIVLVLFIVLGKLATTKFHPEPSS